MRSKIIIVATVVASLLFVPLMASADAVQEQLRLMEQRMAEMEDRLQATSVELNSAKATVDQQQGLLTDAGLIDADDQGLRSGVSDFVNMIDVSGVVAASYNHRLHEADNNGDLAGGNALFRHRDADTFALDQFWVVMDKPVSEESRGGFHIEFVTGQTGLAQGGNSSDEPYLYSGYVSYLAPVGNGVEINVGRLATPFGAEVEQANGNFFVTQGNVFALQPVTHTGISFASEVSDGVSVIFGVVNEVYSDTFTSSSVDKAYYGQVAYSGEDFGVNVGVITGDDSTNCTVPVAGPPAGTAQRADCAITIIDVVMTADPTDDVSLWLNFDYVNTSGSDRPANGEIFGIALAGRLAVTEKTGVSGRIEYVVADDDLVGASDDLELFSLTGTVDHALTDNLMVRGEIRWDEFIDDTFLFAGAEEDQVVALAEILFAF
jgi:hypothetical protein